MATTAQNLQQGTVFVRVQFDRKALDPLLEGLNYVASAGAVRNITQLKEIGGRVIDKLKSDFPPPRHRQDVPQKYRNLRKGFKVFYYTINTGSAKAGNAVGFHIYHELAGDDRARTILASLEDGSVGHYIFPKEDEDGDGKKVLMWKQGRKKVFRRWAFIPQRSGLKYMRKAEIFADQLLASRRTTIERLTKEVIEKGRRFGSIETAKASDFQQLPQGVLDAVLSAGKARSNPLKVVKVSRASLFSKKFFGSNYR